MKTNFRGQKMFLTGHLKKMLPFALLWASISVSLQAQIMPLRPQDRPGIKWKKIDTPHFEVVFPQELAPVGQRTANTLEFLYNILAKTLKQDIKRITVILSNEGVIANGYVTLAPRMSEWFAMPMNAYGFGAVEWIDLLAVHEGRHIVQFDKMNTGWGKLAGFFMGDLGRLIYMFSAVPPWFFEGDAVGIETALTGGGRGRQPAFDMDFRAPLLSGRRYSYDKANFRSYKDWCPSEYLLGYLLTTHVRRTYGPDAWSRILDRITKKRLISFSFSRAMKKEISKSPAELYKEAMDDLEARWKAQSANMSLTDFSAVNTLPRRVWTNYTSPSYDSDGAIYVQKFGLADPLRLVRLGGEGKEEKIISFAPLLGFLNRLSVEKGKTVWNEYVPDPRWGKRSYSDLVLFDLKSGKRKRLTHKARLFDPVLSPDAGQIAAVEFAADYKCALVIFSADTGRRIKRFPESGENLVFLPSWSGDGGRIVMVKQNSRGRTLSVLDVQSGERRDIFPPGRESIDYPVFYKDFILYHSPCSGIDNIYAVHAEKGERYQVTSSKFGAFFPHVSPDGNRLLYSDYSVMGYTAAEASLDPSSWKRFEETEDRSLKYYEPLISQEEGGNIFEKTCVPDMEYAVTTYSPSAHLLNVHSWIPLANPTHLSLLFISSDKMSKSLVTGGLKYHTDEKVLGFELNGSYFGLFPVLDFGLDYGGRSSSYEDKSHKQIDYGWRETSAKAGFHIPLDLSRGDDRCGLAFGAGAAYTKISGREYIEPLENGNGRLFSLNYFFQYSKRREPSIRDLYPTWGHSLELSYHHTPFKGDYKGSLFSAKIGLNLPGLFKHHSLRLAGGYERQKAENYRFPNDALFPRGYDYSFHATLFKASIDYTFPLAYPDLSLGSFLYLKRLKLNVFYDYGLGRMNRRSESFQSVGIDLLAAVYLFRLPVEIETGPRLIYRLKDKSARLDWLAFGISF